MTSDKQKKYELLIDYLVEYDVVGDAICDDIGNEFIDNEGLSWCHKTCKFYKPQKECYEKYMEYLLANNTEKKI